MKNKIKRFAKGDFHIPQPEIIFPETHITMRVEKEKNMREAFLCRMKGKGQYVGLYILLPIVYSAQSRALMEIQ